MTSPSQIAYFIFIEMERYFIVWGRWRHPIGKKGGGGFTSLVKKISGVTCGCMSHVCEYFHPLRKLTLWSIQKLLVEWGRIIKCETHEIQTWRATEVCPKLMFLSLFDECVFIINKYWNYKNHIVKISKIFSLRHFHSSLTKVQR